MNFMWHKQRAMAQKSIEMYQEIIAISQAKGCGESELNKMPLMEYYGNLASFLKYIEERDKKYKPNE